MRWAAGTALCGLLLGATAALAQDDPPGRVGRLAALQGEVWVFEAEQGEWVPALHNRPFTNGDRLSTAAAASVELRIGSTTLTLGGSAELEAVRLDDERLQFRLHGGSLALKLRSREVAAELEVLSEEGRFAPLHAGLYRIDRQDETSDATVWRGEMRFDASDLTLTLHAGQRARFWQTGALRVTASQWLAPLDDEFALAVQRQDQADTRSAATLFVPPEMTGVEELDRYGRWQQHPDYGALWSPTVVVAGWAPYRHGQWIWLRPWGWTWVDDAPWGFAPFHYGRWLWWGNRWCWAPGPVVRRPAFAPALVGWVGGAQGSLWVGGRPMPAVGWVPLAPRELYRPGYRASPGHLNRLNPLAPAGASTTPAFGNRVVPGAVTVVPGYAPRQGVGAAAQRADEMVLQQQWRAEQFHQQAPGRPASPVREFVAPRTAQPGSPAYEAPGRVQPRPMPPAGARLPLPSATVPPQWPAGTAPNQGPAGAAPAPARVTAPSYGGPPQAAQPTAPQRERGGPPANPGMGMAPHTPAVATPGPAAVVPPAAAVPTAPPATSRTPAHQPFKPAPPATPPTPPTPPTPAAPAAAPGPAQLHPKPGAPPPPPRPVSDQPDVRTAPGGAADGERRRIPESRYRAAER